MRKFLEWWILLLAQLSALGLCVYFDLIFWVWQNDVTKISFIILAIWAVVTTKIGFNIWQYERNSLSRDHFLELENTGWFASDQCLSLGMLGTVLGFLIMMSSISLAQAGDTVAIQTMLKTMSLGMSSALITTAVGIVFSNFLKLQLFMCGREL